MNETWKLPPPQIAALLTAPPTPWVLLSPDTRWLLLVDHAALPELSDLARPKLKLAGLRIDPTTNARHQTVFGTGLALREARGSALRRVALPDGLRISGLRWSPDSRRVALTFAGERGTELWVLDAEGAELRRLATGVHAVFGEGFEWLGDGDALLVTLVPPQRGAPPVAPVAHGPSVQDARGEKTPLRTYQDLLASPHDELLFDHHASSVLARVDVATATSRVLAGPALFVELDAAPSERHVLATRVERPFSYQHPVFGFPLSISVLEFDPRETGRATERELVRVPAAENVPIEGVRVQPRGFRWHPTRDATLLWLEALDGGDPRRVAAQRDRWMEQDAPFDAAARELVRVEHRATALSWFADGERFLAREYDRERRWTRMTLRARGRTEALATLDDRSIKDRYADPGGVLLRALPGGRRVVREEDGCIFRASDGESPQGARPFLDRQELATGTRTRLFESAENEYESLYTIVDAGARSTGFITRHESVGDPPNLRSRAWGSATWSALTSFTDPAPELRAIEKQLVTYRRADGVELSGTLYLPPHWNGERLPLVLWAYPRDYVDARTAGQVLDTPHTFTRIGGASQLVFALAGYAVLDDASMPIVGPPETMNDTFVEQSVASARAAIEHLAERGVCDPSRVGIGGHSYGAFMAVMLLAHSRLFRGGIARSGAYNRTLTPFGFQSERRALWEARTSYLALSPFLDADRISAPLLLVHGAEDPNPGTHPQQSERLFQAIKGNGGVARLVVLPHESHAYRARESVLHVVAEMLEWFELYVKNAT